MNNRVIDYILTLLRKRYIGEFTEIERNEYTTLAHNISQRWFAIGFTYTTRSFDALFDMEEEVAELFGIDVHIGPDIRTREELLQNLTTVIRIDVRSQKSQEQEG